MNNKTIRRDEEIDPEAIARWNNEGGAPEPLKRGADMPASAPHDDSEKELGTQAAQDPRRENLAPSVSYDLWRFSCEMPDAPHLCNNLTPP
jgi:hypothetical protein